MSQKIIFDMAAELRKTCDQVKAKFPPTGNGHTDLNLEATVEGVKKSELANAGLIMAWAAAQSGQNSVVILPLGPEHFRTYPANALERLEISPDNLRSIPKTIFEFFAAFNLAPQIEEVRTVLGIHHQMSIRW